MRDGELRETPSMLSLSVKMGRPRTVSKLRASLLSLTIREFSRLALVGATGSITRAMRRLYAS